MLKDQPLLTGWHAKLDLGYERRGETTVMAHREHIGPLRVQKALYPEGRAVCHTLVLHPPAGIVGGDKLEITALVGNNAHALLTTPGAGKWYRSGKRLASQYLNMKVSAGGMLEWLPQESIVFDGAIAQMQSNIDLAADARFIGWEVLCLGRRASGEKFNSGSLLMSTTINQNGKPIWLERGKLEGGSSLLDSSAGLAGYSVSATLLAVGNIDVALLSACRAIIPEEAGILYGLTLLPDLLVARYLGHSSEAARSWMVELWRLLRPAMTGRDAHLPRIWHT